MQGKTPNIWEKFKNLSMEDDKIMDIFYKLSHIRSLVENLSDVHKNFRSVSKNYDAITSSIEHCQEIDLLTLEEADASSKIHEDELKESYTKKEEKTLLVKALGKSKKKDAEFLEEEEIEAKAKFVVEAFIWVKMVMKMMMKMLNPTLMENSLVTNFNCSKFSHYENECQNPKKSGQNDKIEKENINEEETHEISLLIAIEDRNEILPGNLLG